MPLTILVNVHASGGNQDPGHVVIMAPDEQTVNEISPEQRAEVERKIAEHERTKKSKSGVITTFAPSDPPTLQPYAFFPHAGTLWQDLYINNFVDVDSTAGITDWDCTQQSYNGHTGYDSDIRSFREQEIGVPIFAALDGTVVDLHDGEPDMNTSAQGQQANYVILDHGNSHYTWYWHLKNGSVAVTINQVIKAGTQLGLTGSSGNSTHPHLHFESRYNGTFFEPSAGPCRTGASNWVQQVPIRRDMYVSDFGFSTTALSGHPAFDNSSRTGTYTLGTSSEWFRTDLSNVPANSTFQVRYLRPDGAIALDYAGAFNNSGAYRKATFYWNFLVNLNMTGTWRLLISINNQPLVDTPFQVVSSQSQIVNRAPNSITLSLNPASPRASDVIFCRVRTSPILEDPDYDIVRYRYQWSVNGTVVRDVTTAALSDALRKGLTNAGDSVTCHVTPSDGVYSGSAASSAVSISASTGSTCNSISDVEPNDSLAASQVISGACNQISGTFLNDPTSQQNDYFRLSLPAGQTVTALLDGLTVDYDLYIYDAAGTEVASSANGETTPEQASWTNTGDSAVNVYILVWRYSSTRTTYQMKVSYTAGPPPSPTPTPTPTPTAPPRPTPTPTPTPTPIPPPSWDGTANRLAKFSGGNGPLLDSAVSEVGGTLGIGTDTPNTNYKLDVRGNILLGTTRPVSLVADFPGNGEILPGGFFGSLGSNSFTFAPSTDFGNAGAQVKFAYYNGAHWLSAMEYANVAGGGVSSLILMKNGGNVGIGTATPATRLDLSDISISTGIGADFQQIPLIVRNSSNVLNNWRNLAFYADNTLGLATIGAQLTDNTGANRFGALVFGTRGSGGFGERMRITSSGNVGIGMTNPQSALQVNGYVQLALTPGVPPAADCDQAAEYGRMKVDAISVKLYVCTSAGWKSAALQ